MAFGLLRHQKSPTLSGCNSPRFTRSIWIIWKREGQLDFSAWLEENIDYLNDIFEFDISVESREEEIAHFALTCGGKTTSDNRDHRANQLERTDHDHLGKDITYLTNLGANRAVWIAKEPREEANPGHRVAERNHTRRHHLLPRQG